jgi:hypothetical protein
VVQVIEHAPLRRLAGGAPLDQALHVAAGAEVAVGALQDDAADLRVRLGDPERLDAGGDHLGRQRVAGRRVADRQHERRAAPFGQQFGGHRREVFSGCAGKGSGHALFIRGIVSRGAVAPRLLEAWRAHPAC